MNVLIPLAVVTIAGLATLAPPENTLPSARLQPRALSVYFDLVTSDAAGVVEIYDYPGHVFGKLLGSQAVAAGRTSGLRVQMTTPPFNDVLAVLAIDGARMADQAVEFHRHGR